MSELTENKKMMLRELMKQLHAGTPPSEVKDKFKQVLEDLSPLEIAKIEEELIKEGLPPEEIQRLCDVHLAVFKEQLEKQKPQIMPENPIGILMEEHKTLLTLLEKLSVLSNSVQQAGDANRINESVTQMKQIADDLLDADNHYLREENILFPVLERHGIKEPPAIMWTEHKQIREKKKQLQNLLHNYDATNIQDFKTQTAEITRFLNNALSSHVFKENNILLPTAMRVITEQELKDIRKQFDEVGYCSLTPQSVIAMSQAKTADTPSPVIMSTPKSRLQFETGGFSKEEAEAILRTLPVDITFVDKEDTVRYFNKSDIFMRTRAVLGRKVQQCHPQKSVHMVNRILDSFRAGKKDVATFWIQRDGKMMIHIRYFAVRDKAGQYLGTIEVTQDITDLRKIEGERRLLDWKD